MNTIYNIPNETVTIYDFDNVIYNLKKQGIFTKSWEFIFDLIVLFKEHNFHDFYKSKYYDELPNNAKMVH